MLYQHGLGVVVYGLSESKTTLNPINQSTGLNELIPNLSGRRMCLGEQLARQELFIFFTTLMLHFNVKLPEGVTADLEGIEEGLMKPKPYEVIFEARL